MSKRTNIVFFTNFATMSTPNQASATCSKCGIKNQISYYSMINVSASPELKAQVLDGSLFLWECPHCGTKNLINAPTVYIDSQEKLMVVCSPEELSLELPQEGAFADYTMRQVKEIGALMESVKVFDAGLDDEVMDLCKKVTVMEMGREVSLRFVKMNGPDNEIIFTFPQNGQMEMIAIGFNVYEDCRTIIDGHRR